MRLLGWVCVVICLASISRLTWAAPAEEIELSIQGNYSSYNLSAFLSYHLDTEATAHLGEMRAPERWTRNTGGDALGFGFTNHPVWLRFGFSLPEGTGKRWHIVIPYALLDDVRVYLTDFDTGQLLWASDLERAYQSPLTARAHQINFALPDVSGNFVIYLRATSSASMQLPVMLWEREALIQQESLETLLWGLYFGIIIALCIYNGFLLASIRDFVYFHYVMALVSLTVLMLSISGFGRAYFWSDPQLNTPILAGSGLLSSLWMLLFAAGFFSAANTSRWILNSIRVFCGLLLVALLLVINVPRLDAQVTGFMAAAATCIVLMAGFSALMSGYVIARYFVLANAAVVLGTNVYLASVFDLIPSNMLTRYSLPAGSALQALLFSFALAHRIKEERRQKLAAMRETEETQRSLVEIKNHALQQALRDPVTRMPNDALLLNRVEELIRATHVYGAFAVVQLYFPHLRDVSANMGRKLAEDLFKSVIRTIDGELEENLQSIVIDSETHSRVAVTEFANVICLFQVGDGYKPLDNHLAALLHLFDRPLEIEGTSIRLDVYTGIACYPADGDKGELLLQHAASARDYGLRSSARVTRFSKEIDDFGRRRLALVGELLHAIRSNGLELYVQPQYRCGGHQLCGGEILLRWCSDSFGIVSPMEFIEVAEESGLMPELTRFVVDAAFQTQKSYETANVRISLSINLSIQDLLDDAFLPFVMEAAQRHGIDLKRIIFEVTETSMTNDMDRVIDCLSQLADLGCGIALDDFGTGYSSLAYLSRLPIHELKIDRSFINQMERSDSDYRIVENTIKLARALQIETVAEGVESVTAVTAVTRMGCDRLQGYYFSKPMPAHQFVSWVERQSAASMNLNPK